MIFFIEFPTTNNEAKYDALITGLKIVREAGAQHLKIFSDSQLVVRQVKGEYEAKEDNMKRYLLKVKGLISSFTHFDIQQVPRS